MADKYGVYRTRDQQGNLKVERYDKDGNKVDPNAKPQAEEPKATTGKQAKADS